MSQFQVASSVRRPDPDPRQEAAVTRILGGGDTTVLGGPGSGKTTVLGAVAAGLGVDDRVLVLSQSRQRAAAFNERYLGALHSVRRGALSLTPVALAFAVASGRALREGAPTAPRLLSGSEQDRLFAELLRGELTGDVPSLPWPRSVPPQTRALAGFRTELRDLYMRCIEYGVSRERLHELADEQGIQVWHAAAEFFQIYADTKAATFRFGDAWDSSELLQRAADFLENGELPERLHEVRWVLIDDAQDLTPAAIRLVRGLCRPGVTIAACGDPDVGVNSFRGGSPVAATQLLARVGREAPRLLLGTSHRLGGSVLTVAQRLVGGIGVSGEARHRQMGSSRPGASARVRVRIASGDAAQGLVLAEELRTRHLIDRVPWGQMAVICRSGSSLPAMAADLEDAGVPVTAAGVERPLREHPLVWELLRWIVLATSGRTLTATEVTELLGGELIGLDPLELRRLRHALRENEFADTGHRSSSQLLEEAFLEPDIFHRCGGAVATRAAHAAALFGTLSAQLTSGTSTPAALWTVWAGARREETPGRSAFGDQLQQTALTGGPEAARAAASLDAVRALFAAAERFAERFPESQAAAFVHSLLEQAVPEDTLALRENDDAVVLATPAAIAGREFEFVAVSGLQEGVWPNLRIRGTLLHAPELPNALEQDGPLDARRQVLDDELRFFYTAMTRSRGEVLLTASSQGDELPSPFILGIQAGISPDSADGNSADTSAASSSTDTAQVLPVSLAAPLTLRGLTAVLRRRLTAEPADSQASEWAAALHMLTEMGVREADPHAWAGLLPPVGMELDPPRNGVISVSPSALESFEQDPAGWFLNRIGARPSGTAQGIGTLVHRALQRSAEEGNITLPFLTEQVRSGWGDLEFAIPWEGRERWARVQTMLELLQTYLRRAQRDGWRPVAAEQEFSVRLGAASLHGFIDRIEANSEGLVRIVDLKTGGSAISVADARQNLQLASYQLALGGLPLPGIPAPVLQNAFLLYVGAGGKKAKTRIQKPMSSDDREAFVSRIEEIAHGMGSGRYPVSERLGPRTADSELLGIPEVTE